MVGIAMAQTNIGISAVASDLKKYSHKTISGKSNLGVMFSICTVVKYSAISL